MTIFKIYLRMSLVDKLIDHLKIYKKNSGKNVLLDFNKYLLMALHLRFVNKILKFLA